jgi:16S rRNA processing protein RimM
MRVVVGRIGRPHGIGGEVTVEVRTDEPDARFAPGSRLLVDPPGPDRVVSSARWHSGRLLLRLEGVADRSAAEALRGTLLHVERSADEVPDEPDDYYDSTLVGCAAVLTDGTAVGEVEDVLHLPAQDLLVVRTAAGAEVLVPFVAAIVPEVDLEDRRIVLDPPDGLLDSA